MTNHDPSTGYINPRVSWPRPATPTALTPAWAGEFVSFDDWVSKATTRLTGTYDPLMGAEIPSICIDNIGRRCTMGGHFARARDEGTFPVRYFFDCAPQPRTPCVFCNDTGWVNDENWEPDYPEVAQERAPHKGLIECSPLVCTREEPQP